MARPATAANTQGVTLDVLSSPTAADGLAAELYDLADRVDAEARENGTSRITEARVRGLRRHAGQFDRIARSADADDTDSSDQ